VWPISKKKTGSGDNRPDRVEGDLQTPEKASIKAVEKRIEKILNLSGGPSKVPVNFLSSPLKHAERHRKSFIVNILYLSLTDLKFFSDNYRAIFRIQTVLF